jgi:hypothetical protein
VQFPETERMKTEREISSQKAVTPLLVDIQTGAPRNEDVARLVQCVVDAFEGALPATVLMDFIQYQQWSAAGLHCRDQGTGLFDPGPAEHGIVPVEVSTGFSFSQKHFGQCRLTALPRSRDKSRLVPGKTQFLDAFRKGALSHFWQFSGIT